MKCNMCDRDLSDAEIIPNPLVRGGWEPCSTCLDVAFDAAFSNGFQRGDGEDPYIELGDADEIEILDSDAFVSDNPYSRGYSMEDDHGDERYD